MRDLVFGGDIKDLDVFVSIEDTRGTLDYPSLHRTHCFAAQGYQTGMRDEVRVVEQFSTPRLNIPLQVIHLGIAATPTFGFEAVERMDFDCCRAFTRDGRNIIRTTEFGMCAVRNRFTLLRCEDVTQAKRSMRRAKSFRERYPTVEIVVSLAQERLAAAGEHVDRIAPAVLI